MTRRQNFYGVACAGNWIVDLLHTIDHWPQENDLARITKASSAIGGGAANVAFDLQAFGVSYPILPIGLIGKDEYGDRITASCLNRRLSTEFLYESQRPIRVGTCSASGTTPAQDTAVLPRVSKLAGGSLYPREKRDQRCHCYPD
jgi:sugar/nucleoside kinase (ribokinase family)